MFRSDPTNPTVGYLGSSNLTQSGLSLQGELNLDVLDHDACQKLAAWFEERWNDRWCVDISDELAAIIEESWARERLIPPHNIYVKIAYHLSQEARAGLTEFRIPRDFGNQLLDFQTAAVKIAAHHLNKRGGVLIGDVVGLGKTLMATALARVFEDDHGLETLVICPRNLVPMWEDHRDRYRLRARVLSMSRVLGELPDLRRYRLVLIDESHNLRNRQGKRYRAIHEYIRENESKCILLTATPYNKTYLDLSSQLRLFVPEAEDLGIRPERLLREMGETEFMRHHQAPVRSLAAFEQSPYAEDWRELMRLYLVRRTRSFVQDNYAARDPADGRRYLTFEGGERSYFPTRVPRTLPFEVDAQYGRLFADDVVAAINTLGLPRYGLGNYVTASPPAPPTLTEARVLDDLSRAGKRLMGFCRTNLFKRLESSGHAFLLSVERHVLRNFVFLHAIENGLPLPIGTADAGLLDVQSSDEDAEAAAGDLFDVDGEEDAEPAVEAASLRTEEQFHQRASQVYALFSGRYRRRFRWLPAHHFETALREDLTADAATLRDLLVRFGEWRAAADAKLGALVELLRDRHAERKVLVFTQFADTVRYLEGELRSRGVSRMEAATGDTEDPTSLAWRFSPRSNDRESRVADEDELRVLVATDVLSEGQNLQDCAIVVNYDLPWAIIRLIQRAGRVDRIGQRARDILCYSFLPAEGVERLLRLRARVRDRLSENAEVVGADEAFFEGDDERTVLDLYHEKAGILDGDDDTDVDLSSYAYQIWRNAIAEDPALRRRIEDLPPVVHSSKAHHEGPDRPAGALVYLRTAQGYDSLVYIDRDRRSVTQSQFEILRAAACPPDTPALPRHETHHALVAKAAAHIAGEEKQVGGQLGRPSGARFRTYERLKSYAESIKGLVFDTPALRQAIDDIYRYPLRQTAVDTLNRQLRSGISDQPSPSWSPRSGTRAGCASSTRRTNAASRASSARWASLESEMPTPLDRDRVSRHLQSLNLRELFIGELGWDHGGEDLEVKVAGRTFALEAVAHKRGLVVYRYLADSDDAFPGHPVRQKIERAVAGSVREHLVVYATSDRSTQCWQWVKREAGRPDLTRTHIYGKGQSGEALIQKLDHLVFTLEEEEGITIVDPSSRVRAAFDVENVTKRFYDRFKQEHEAFLDFIEGITAAADREWYASLMLNRMMFIYFIQKRSFLDGDPDYLRNRLERVRREQGHGKFHSFYRVFLLRLFHEGLGRPEADRAPELAALLGEVPYLNGGLFDEHDLERDNPDIHIPDDAFERILAFFDAYQWHLDDRPLRKDNEINPDVLGYIFEKYVNQKQMGAYYTKEDITGYISRNTVIPSLFDRARKDCAIAFKPGGGVWRLLKDHPDRYFYEAVRDGISYDAAQGTALTEQRPLPIEIAAGVHDVSKRGGWNEPVGCECVLPTETWREHVARRQRYEEVRAKLAAGEVTSISDVVTYNLDIEKFAQDVIAGSEGPELVRAFWKALRAVSILDPTCGSGAFLFAALNILEPLYNACLDAMRGFLDDLERSGRKHRPEKFSDFREALREVDGHASERYFILKSIIIDNLYGVDVMEEAVEICKLRLFLKLVAQLEDYEQSEPLPDIDFNVRAGNTLVGFASLGEVKRTLDSDMIRRASLTEIGDRIEERAEIASRAFGRFRAMQTEQGMDAAWFAGAKSELRTRLDDLGDELDGYLAGEYGVTGESAFRRWRERHQPFHWFVEFYDVMQRGGFDVIIGNPPWRELTAVKEYTTRGYQAQRCGNLHGLCTERSVNLAVAGGRFSFIVQLPMVSSSRMVSVRDLLSKGAEELYVASFDDRPGKLFDGLQHCRCVVFVARIKNKRSRRAFVLHTSRYQRWHTGMRDGLFQRIRYSSLQGDGFRGGVFPNLDYARGADFGGDTGATVWYKRSAHNVLATTEAPA